MKPHEAIKQCALQERKYSQSETPRKWSSSQKLFAARGFHSAGCISLKAARPRLDDKAGRQAVKGSFGSISQKRYFVTHLYQRSAGGHNF